MAANGDARDREREDEVEDDHPEGAATEHVVALPLEDEARSENPEDRTRGAHGRLEWIEQQSAGRACKPGDQIEQQELSRADALLEQGAEPVERDHVQQQVERPVVQESGRDQPPVVALRDTDQVTVGVNGVTCDEHALLVDRAVNPVDAPARRELGDVDRDVEGDQGPCHLGADALESGALYTAGHALDALRAARVLRAADPDRSHRHAFRADRTAALRAGEPGDAVRVAVAGLLGELGHRPK